MIKALLKEIDRNKKLVKRYDEIGPPGRFGATCITMDIKEAERAVGEGDTVGMVRSLASLRGNE